MEFKDFFGILYQYCSDGTTIDEFMRDLFETIVSDPKTRYDKDRDKEGNYNPFYELTPSTFDAYAKGRRTIAKSKAKFVLSHLNKKSFSNHVNYLFKKLPGDSLNRLMDDLKRFYDNDISPENIGDVCATLFENILKEIVEFINFISLQFE